MNVASGSVSWECLRHGWYEECRRRELGGDPGETVAVVWASDGASCVSRVKEGVEQVMRSVCEGIDCILYRDGRSEVFVCWDGGELRSITEVGFAKYHKPIPIKRQIYIR